MKKTSVNGHGIVALNKEECASITGGGEVKTYVRCVATTLTSGGGAMRTMLLGVGLFGLARILGVAVGCANL